MRSPGERFAAFRDYLGLSYAKMGEHYGFPASNVEYYEKKARTIPTEFLDALKTKEPPEGKEYPNISWIVTGEGLMLRKATFEDLLNNAKPPWAAHTEAPDPRVLPEDLAMADQWVEEIVLQGKKNFQLRDKWEWIHLVAEEIAAARVRGQIPEARQKVERFVRLAKGLTDAG